MKEITTAQRNRRRIIIIISLFILLLIIFLIGCCIGQYALSLDMVFKTFFGNGNKNSNMVIFEFRLPRLCMTILIGLGMGASGVILQNLLHNDLASPGTLGVADGSSLFVTLYFAFIAKNNESPELLPILAFAGGIISTLIIYLLSTKKRKQISPIKLIMTGVAMGACYGAISTFLMFILDETQLASLQRWSAGDISNTIPWTNVLVLFIWITVLLIISMLLTRILDVINLGYDIATGLGVNIKIMFFVLIFVAVAMSSASVAFGGNFFFLGLIGPHIARKLVGTKTKYLIPAAGVVSA